MSKHFTIADFNRLYPTNASCLEAIFTAQYDTVDKCPGCMEKTKFSRLKRRKCYSCQWCGHQIHPLAGTIFHKSRTPLKKWFFAIYLFASSKNGVSGAELSRQLGVTYKCGWRIANQIRTLFQENVQLRLEGIVEADESWFGHTNKKVPVAGLVERGGKIITQVVPDVSSHTLAPFVKRHVVEGSRLMTDEHKAYIRLRRMGYFHETTNHRQWQWKTGEASTNTLEGHWGLIKRAIRGTHVSISAKYVHLYVSEYAWKRNHRGEQLFPLLVSRSSRPSRLFS